MLTTLMEMMSYVFMIRAVVVGLLVSLCASLLGVSLVLKRYSMIGDGLSHVGFGALAIAAVLNAASMAVTIPVVILAALLLLRISDNGKIKGDAAIALIASSALAIGVVAVSMSGLNTDITSYLFGSILSMSDIDTYISVALSITVITLFILFYNKIFAITFDDAFARATGTKIQAYNIMIALLTAVTIVVGMRMMGALLISSLIVFPALTAMRVCRTFKSVTICSAVISVVCFCVGVTVSYVIESPVGASIVIINAIAFVLFSIVGLLRRFGVLR